MNYDDQVPEDDQVARGARYALHQLAGTRTLDASWADVQQSARRVKQRRLSAIGAACVVVLLGTGVAVAAGGSDGRTAKDVRGESSTTTTSTSTETTTTSAPFGFGPTSPPPTRSDGSPIATIPTAGPTGPTGSTGPDVVQPQDGSWDAVASVDSEQVTVGDTVTVHAELRNTGTKPQSTVGYGSLAIACDRVQEEGVPSEDIRFGEFLDWVVLQPGEARSFSMTFVAESGYAPELNCGVGIAFHGDAYAASPFEYPQGYVTMEILPATEPTTSTTSSTVPTTDTTTP
jgi:hypothetical protein